MSGLAGLGAFAGGLAGGIREGDRLTTTKLAREDARQGMTERAKASTRAEQFARLMQGLMSDDPAVVDAARGMAGQKAKTVTPGGTGNAVPSAVAPGQMTMQSDMPAPTANPYAGAGLGTV